MSDIQQLIKSYSQTKNPQNFHKIIELIKTSDKLWIAYSPITKGHYIEYFRGSPTAFIFSEKEFCEDFKAYLVHKKVKIESMESPSANRSPLFSDMFRSGVESIIIDNGKTFLSISLFDIINKPDFSKLPENQRPAVNIPLMKSASIFFQSFDAGTQTKDMELNMMRDIYNAKYLLPIIFDGSDVNGSIIKEVTTGSGPSINIPELSHDGRTSFIPIFTDWIELSKFDKDKKFVGNLVTFQDIEYFCKNGERISINPLGFNMIIDKNVIDVIKNSVADTEDNSEHKENITLFNLDAVPNDMIIILQRLLDQTEGVQSAYLKGIKHGDDTGYLAIIDFRGSNTAVFEDIARQVGPYTQGVSITFVTLNSEFGRAAAQNTYPFYQKISID